MLALIGAFQLKEKAFAHVVKIGRTQLQDAVPTTLGREMSAYAHAFGRDRRRISECEEHLQAVNLGGTAIGTGIAAPRQYITAVTDHLREITDLGLTRAEDLVEATQNTDVFIEVSGILNAFAGNLLKIATDLRLLSSSGFGEVRLPSRQAGSSIMPSKVNPVIPEAVTQAAIVVMANNNAISQACTRGNLELNAFLPLVADALLNGLDLLSNACGILRRHCVEGLEADEVCCREHLAADTAVATALVGPLGYKQAEEIALAAHGQHKSVRQVVLERGLLTQEDLDRLMSLENLPGVGTGERPEP